MTLFDVEPVKPPGKVRVSTVPKWESNTTQTKCYECVRLLAAGEFITAMRAQWKRTLGGATELLCYPHAIPLRDADHETAKRAQ